MSKPSLEEIQRRVAAIAGHDPNVIAQMKAGAVFEIDDALIRFPENVDREPHAFRRVIIVQSAEYLTGTAPKTALVVPCSASGSRGRGDVAIAENEPGFTKACVAYTTLVMPVLRADLRRENFKGHVRPETLALLHAQLHKLLAG